MNDPIKQAIDSAFADLDQSAFDLHAKYVELMFDIMQRRIDVLTRERDYYRLCAESNHGVLMGRMQ
jgi:hypothetical protein